MKVGVLLAGCGVEDGSEIYESVLTILALERLGVTVQAMAPDIVQAEVVNHYTGEEARMEKRNVLPEAARIVRGKIIGLQEVSAHEIDALIIPGGYGVVKNLCSYAADGDNASVQADVARLIQQVHGLGKPIGAICAAPILVALALRDQDLTLTVGSDGKASASLTRLGATPVATGLDEIYIDDRNAVVSTPAFLMAHSVSEAEAGINKLVEQVVAMARALVAPSSAPEPAVMTPDMPQPR